MSSLAEHEEYRPALDLSASLLLQRHGQRDYSLAVDDDIVCAPIGYYRLLRRYDKNSPEQIALKDIVFAFNTEDLETTTHPEHSSLRVLKHPERVIPLPQKAEPFLQDWAMNAIKIHQQEWLTFILSFGNLYPHRQPEAEYYANNFISYAIFRESDTFRVTYRCNPFNDKANFGLDQADGKTFKKWMAESGVEIADGFQSRAEALKFIHQDFFVRYERFFNYEDPQSFYDPQLLHSMAMWWHARLEETLENPTASFTRLLKIMAVAIMPLKPSEMILEGVERIAEGTVERMELDETLGAVANIEDESRLANYPFRAEVVNDWVVVEGDKLVEELGDILPHVRLSDHKLSHVFLSGVQGPNPVIVKYHGKNTKEQAVLSTLGHDGLHIYHLPNKQAVIVYSPEHRFVPKEQKHLNGLPDYLSVLFQEGMVAHITPCDPQDNNGQRIQHSFLPMTEGYELIASHFKGDAKQLATVDGHSMPQFAGNFTESANDNNSITLASPENSNVTFFRRCAENITHYAGLFNFNRYREKRALWTAAASLVTGLTTTYFNLPDFIPVMFFAFSANALTRRFAANARSPREASNLNVVSNSVMAASCLYAGFHYSKELMEQFSRGEPMWVDENRESMGALGALTILTGFSVNNLRTAFKLRKSAKHNQL